MKTTITGGLELDHEVRRAAEAICSADALLIGAGAGMGVDSGLPDFRGKEGFWRAYPAVGAMNLSFEELANPLWFEKEPELAWAFYGHRLNLYRSTIPHEGFRKLLELADSKPAGYFVYTSNVDGQFQNAGFQKTRIVECHGSIQHFQCTKPCMEEIWKAPAAPIEIDAQRFRAMQPLPKCKHCGRVARPNVLMFGDPLWVEHRSALQERRLEKWLAELAEKSARLAVVELGAGTAIASVRYACERTIRTHDAKLIRINPREHVVPEGQIRLSLGAAEGIREIAAALR